MDTKIRLTRKPMTTVLWVILTAAMALLLSVGAALLYSSGSLAGILDKYHTSIATRTDRAVYANETEDGVWRSYEKKWFYQSHIDQLEAMDSVEKVYFHTLTGGFTRHIRVMERATPYHFAHSTQVAGCIFTYGGDDRLYNNLFAGISSVPEDRFHVGTDGYDGFTTPQEYPVLLAAEGNTDEAKYAKIMQPVYLGGNVYGGTAKCFRAEDDALMLHNDMPMKVAFKDGRAVLTVNLPKAAADAKAVPVSTLSLGMPRVTECPYDNPDGTPVDFAPDMLGVIRGEGAMPGPIAELKAGENVVTIWQ